MTEEAEQLRILIGRDGWLRVALVPLQAGSMGTLDDAQLGAAVLARAAVAEGGQLALTEVRLTHPSGLTNDVFRGFPFTRIASALNIASIAAAIHERIVAGVDIVHGDDPVPEPATDELAVPAGPYCWRFPNGTVVANVAMHSTRADLVLRPYPETNPRLRNLAVKGKRPDEFYRQLASVFTHARAVEGRPGPAQRIASANDVPVTTVHRWVKEARRRGFFDTTAEMTAAVESLQSDVREGRLDDVVERLDAVAAVVQSEMQRSLDVEPNMKKDGR